MIRAADGGVLAYLLWVLRGVWLVDRGAPMLSDGLTDLLARRRWRTVRDGRAMELGSEGVRHNGAFPRERGARAADPDVIVGWDSVADAVFRPGPDESWWFCLDLVPAEWPAQRALTAAIAVALDPSEESRPVTSGAWLLALISPWSRGGDREAAVRLWARAPSSYQSVL
ncbi:hypothetical protein [Cryptosporangium aurantiacum]|uniref:Uncharacterized protein n=1 Tax=Cryptosporangium aurantiacum TaxID=134849 RepID=A0A1M7PCP0_9ACTN|nr:hypothetical protein [Cryptosporangium aurantiacum]SHN14344.1 hypothetical protein SAMN05443668_103179 [Cryptosporangium aurantiacum]